MPSPPMNYRLTRSGDPGIDPASPRIRTVYHPLIVGLRVNVVTEGFGDATDMLHQLVRYTGIGSAAGGGSGCFVGVGMGCTADRGRAAVAAAGSTRERWATYAGHDGILIQVREPESPPEAGAHPSQRAMRGKSSNLANTHDPRTSHDFAVVSVGAQDRPGCMLIPKNNKINSEPPRRKTDLAQSASIVYVSPSSRGHISSYPK
ncbi:hypothetical protein DFH09DRAFT_1105813 [Mycena vulgaris]|nr:hypothetical protein DFH09DRAFT_1105813 [Mycena vulgaris]